MSHKGFTLIELLVVVLIIGILSSIALPQYTKAIKRSRASEAWAVAKSLLDAEQLYYLENREYSVGAGFQDALRIRFPQMKNFDIVPPEETSKNPPFIVQFKGTNSLAGLGYGFSVNADSTRTIVCLNDANCPNLLPCPPTQVEDTEIGDMRGKGCSF